MESEIARLSQFINGSSQGPPSREDLQAVVDRMRTHQLELEAQNRQLRQIQDELSSPRHALESLLNQEFVAFLQLAGNSAVERANERAAVCLGVERSRLENHWFTDFILPEDQDSFYFFRRGVIEEESGEVGPPRSVVIRLRTEQWIQISMVKEGDRLWLTLVELSGPRQARIKDDDQIANLLHGRVGAPLTAVSFQLVCLEKVFGEEPHEVLSQCQALVRSAMQALSSLLVDLRGGFSDKGRTVPPAVESSDS